MFFWFKTPVKRNLLILVMWMMLPCGAMALEMGDIEVHSFLNEPLRATVPVNNIDSGFVEDIKIGLADPAAYRQLGLDRPSYLTRLNFVLTQGDNNRHQLNITSRERIREPIMELLIKVTGQRNIVMRLYTLMLEFDYPEASKPPIISATPPQTVSADVNADTTTIKTKGGSQPMPSTTTEVASLPESEPEEPVKQVSGDVSVWPLESDNTLVADDRSISILAQDSPLHPEYSVYQIMRGFYLLNPDAFLNGNINKLVAGSRLEVPQPSLVAELNRQQSINFVYSVSRDKQTAIQQQQSESQSPPQLNENTANVEIPPLIGQSFGYSPNLQIPLPMPASLEAKRLKQMEQKLQQLELAMQKQIKTIEVQNSQLDNLNQQLIHKEEVIDHLNVRVQQVESMEPEQATKPEKSVASSPLPNQAVNAVTNESPGSEVKPATESISRLDQLILQARSQLEISESLERPNTNADQAADNTQPAVTGTARQSAPINAGAKPNPIPAAEIVVVDEAPTEAFSSLFVWVIGGMVVVFSVILIGYEFWRRNRSLTSGTANVAQQDKRADKTTTRKMGFEDTYQVMAVDTGVSDRRKAERHIDVGMDDTMQAEIDMLIEYGEYEEAQHLLEQAREQFPDDDWLDIMELNILGHTRDYARFFSRFDQYKQHLMHQHPQAWEEILKLSATLSAEMQRPAQA